MSCGADRLSELPDDLLLRVLHFAPAKEAASTTALSRAWRSPLWRSSGAVNVGTRIEDYRECHALFFSRRDAFVSAAVAALDAADVVPVTRLTLRLEFVGHEYSVHVFMHDIDSDSDGSPSPDRDVLGELLSHRSARRVEELRLAAKRWSSRIDAYKEDEIMPLQYEGMFKLCLGSLPSETLRVLELTGCKGLGPLPPASAVVFSRLSSLQLHHCTARIDALKSLLDAAPAVAAIHLEAVTIAHKNDTWVYPYSTGSPSTETVQLRCPAATVLVLDRCYWNVKERQWTYQDTKRIVLTVEIDAPRLQRFRYKGIPPPVSVSLSPPPADLARVELNFVPRRNQKGRSDNDPSRERDLVRFWRFLQSFPNTRELKMRVTALEHIAVLSTARRLELLPLLSNLRRLELQGVHRPKGKTAAVAIGNLLRCCPALRELLIDLTVAHHEPGYLHSENAFVERKSRSDRHRSSAPKRITELGANYEEVSELPGLTHQRSFNCLQSSLTRVGLRFRLEHANCLGAKLIKFFADNAMVLEEMCIDAGNDKLDEHMACKVERWIAAIRTKPVASRFVVLPLKTRGH